MRRFTLLLAVIVITASRVFAADEPKPRVLAVEEAIRAVSERYRGVFGSFPSWPARTSDGADPGPYPDDGFYGDDLLDDDAIYTLVSRIYFRVNDIAFSSLKTEIVDGGDPTQLQFMRDVMPPTPTPETYIDVFAQLIPILKQTGTVYSAKASLSPTTAFPATFRGSGLVSDFIDCSTAISRLISSQATGNNGYSVFPATTSGQMWWRSFYGETALQYAQLHSVINDGQPVSSGEFATVDGAVLFFFDTLPGKIKLFTTQTQRRTDWIAGTFAIQSFPFVAHSTIQGGAITFVPVTAPRAFPAFIGCASIPLDKEFRSTTTVYFMAIGTFSRSWDRVWTEGVDCNTCVAACPANTPQFGNESLEFRASLGMGSDGSAGFFQLSAKTSAGNLGNPAALRRVLRTGATALYDQTLVQIGNTPLPRQVLAPQVLADIVTLDDFTFEIRNYRPADKGTAGTNGLYAPTAVPFGVTKVENLDRSLTTSNHVLITVTNGADVERAEFTYDAATQGWTLRHERRGETKVESRSSTTDASGRRVELHTFRDGANQITRAYRNTFQVFPWNMGPNARNAEEVVESVLDPDGLAEKTTYAFYTDAVADGFNYGRLKLRVEPSGDWRQFEYDDGGRVTKTTSPFGNTSPGATVGVRVRRSIFSFNTPQWTDIDTIVQADGTTVEVGRSFRTSSFGTAQAIVAQSPGAAYNAADNLVTTTRYINFGNFWGKVQIFTRPEGTGFIKTYSAAAGKVTTTTFDGAFNAARNNIVAGTRTVSVTDDKTQVVSESRFDLVTGLALSTKIATQFDADGRVTRYDYNNGDVETRGYGCCGLEFEVDRDGVRTNYTYDAWGRMQTKALGGVTERYAYDLEGRPTGTYRIGTDGTEVPIETRIYNAAGEIASSTAFGTRTTTFGKVVDPTGQTIRTTTYADGATRVETVGRDGRLVAIGGTAAAPTAFEYGVDAAGAFTREIRLGSAGEQTEWVRAYTDFAGRHYKTVYPDGAVEQSTFNSAGQLVRRTDADGVSTLFAYDSLGELEHLAVDVNRNGVIDFSGTDRIVRTRRDIVSSHGKVMQRATTTLWTTNNSTVTQDISVLESSFDGRSVWRTLHGLTTQMQVTTDGAGLRTETVTMPDGITVTRRFQFGRLASETQAHPSIGLHSSSTLAYDPHGRVQTSTDARNGATTFAYYGDDQVRTETAPDPDPARTGPGYDAQVTTYTYDSMGRVATIVHPDAGVTTNSYHPTGLVRRTTGARVTPIEYSYDAQGRIKTLTTWKNFAGDTGRAATTWNYDPQRGWLNAKLHADGIGPAYTYTPGARLKTRTWARGVVTTYGYNEAGTLATTTYSDGTPAISLTFDRLGRLATKTDGTGACAYSYDGATGLITAEAHGAGLLAGMTVNRAFDSLKRLAAITTLSGANTLNQAGYGYDAASRMQTVTRGTLAATYAYASNAQWVQSLSMAANGNARLTTTKSRDYVNRLTSIGHAPSGATAVSHAYTYDAADQRTQATREDGSSWRYGYDALGQVTAAQRRRPDMTAMLGHDFATTFDDIGNRQTATTNGRTSTYQTNSLNQYAQRTVPGAIDVLGSATTSAIVTAGLQPTQRQGETFYGAFTVDNTTAPQNPSIEIVGIKNLAGPNGEDLIAKETRTAFLPRSPEVFSHDPDGNLIADGRWSYTWDGENRLVAMETSPAVAAVLPSLKQRLEFAYDFHGRRIRKTVQNGGSAGYTTVKDVRFAYEGWSLQVEMDALAGNAVIRTYTWGLDLSGTRQGGGGTGGLLAVHGTADSYAVAHDGNGNVSALVNLNDGTLAADYDYGPAGELLRAEGPAAAANPFRFSTSYADAETGLVYFGYRYYQPGTQRWLSRDPIEEPGGENLYAMVGNDTVNLFDVLGLRMKGHHLIPESAWRAIFGNTKVWDEVVDTVAGVIPTPDHNFTAHFEYNRRVAQTINDYLNANRIGCRCVTKKQAEALLAIVKNSKDPYIQGFNKAARGGIEAVKRWSEREGKFIAAGETKLIKDASSLAGKKGARGAVRYARYAGKIVKVVTVGTFIYTVSQDGLKAATIQTAKDFVFYDEINGAQDWLNKGADDSWEALLQKADQNPFLSMRQRCEQAGLDYDAIP